MTNEFLDALALVNRKQLHLIWATLTGVVYILPDGALNHRGRKPHTPPPTAVGYLRCSGAVSAHDYIKGGTPWGLSRFETIKRGINSLDWTDLEENLLDDVTPMRTLDFAVGA